MQDWCRRLFSYLQRWLPLYVMVTLPLLVPALPMLVMMTVISIPSLSSSCIIPCQHIRQQIFILIVEASRAQFFLPWVAFPLLLLFGSVVGERRLWHHCHSGNQRWSGARSLLPSLKERNRVKELSPMFNFFFLLFKPLILHNGRGLYLHWRLEGKNSSLRIAVSS